MEIKLIYYGKEIKKFLVSPSVASLYAGCTKLKARIDGSKMTFSVIEAVFDPEEEVYELILEDTK